MKRKLQYIDIYNFLKNKKILVTGHTGFVGSWLCAALDYFGAEIIGFAWKEEKGALYDRIKNEVRLKNYYGDLRNKNEIRDCIEKNKPDIIFHLAAYGFIHECKSNPYTAFTSNVMGTVNLLEVIKDNPNIKVVIVASSDKVYRNNDAETQLFKEEDALGGMDPYSCSKTCEDLIVQSYFDTYFKEQNRSVTILRPSNIIGGGDHNTTRLIPSIINSILEKKKIEIRNPDAVRPWQSILDAVDAYIVGAMKAWNTNSMQIYNVGPTQENIRSVGEIAEILTKATETKENIYLSERDSKTQLEKKYLGLAVEKIKQDIEWEPHKKLEETLCDTYNFYKEWDDKNSYELCQKYIGIYYGKA